jgi:hypothetical protein
VISLALTISAASSLKSTLLALLIPTRKKEQRDNSIPSLKKKHLKSGHVDPANRLARDRSPSRKNSLNIALSRRLSSERNVRGDRRTVTTSHVFSPNKRRKAVSVLPISLRNSGFSGGSYCHTRIGGRGGQPHTADNVPRSRCGTGKSSANAIQQRLDLAHERSGNQLGL